MLIKIHGNPLPVKNLNTARLRDLFELQQQTGMKLHEIREAAEPGSVIQPAVMAFLSKRGAGEPFTWDDALELSFDDIEVVVEPGDIARQEADAADPQSPSGASAPDAADHEAEPRPAARPRKKQSPGSTSK